jgi:fucose permease
VVVLGKPQTASSRLDLAQAFNSLGIAVAPVAVRYVERFNPVTRVLP